MLNVKFRCALALSAADAKENQSILSSTLFTVAKYRGYIHNNMSHQKRNQSLGRRSGMTLNCPDCN